MRVRQWGFSLLELMIVVAVIGILAMIALPNYIDQVEKGRRAEGRAALLTVAQAQERFYTANGSYAANLGSINANDLPTINNVTGLTENGYYTVSTTGGTTFTVTANTAGSQTGDDDFCAIMRINNLGVKTAEDSSSNDTTDRCWR